MKPTRGQPRRWSLISDDSIDPSTDQVTAQVVRGDAATPAVCTSARPQARGPALVRDVHTGESPGLTLGPRRTRRCVRARRGPSGPGWRPAGGSVRHSVPGARGQVVVTFGVSWTTVMAEIRNHGTPLVETTPAAWTGSATGIVDLALPATYSTSRSAGRHRSRLVDRGADPGLAAGGNGGIVGGESEFLCVTDAPDLVAWVGSGDQKQGPTPRVPPDQCHLAYVDHAAAVVNLAIVMVGG